MGYCMTQYDSQFKVLALNKPAALDAIQKLAGRETITDSTGRHFSWVSTDDFPRADTLEEALKAWRWESETDDDNNIIGISFQGQKLGDDPVLFKAIAPYVESGSHIDMQGEDGTLWRWAFNGGGLDEENGEVSFVGGETFIILITEHSDDMTATIHRSREGAEDALLEYVQTYWKNEVGNEPMPEDRAEAIRAYFEISEEGYKIIENTKVYP